MWTTLASLPPRLNELGIRTPGEEYRYSAQVATLTRAKEHLKACLRELTHCKSYEERLASVPGDEFNELHVQGQELLENIEGVEEAVLLMAEMQNEKK